MGGSSVICAGGQHGVGLGPGGQAASALVRRASRWISRKGMRCAASIQLRSMLRPRSAAWCGSPHEDQATGSAGRLRCAISCAARYKGTAASCRSATLRANLLIIQLDIPSSRRASRPSAWRASGKQSCPFAPLVCACIGPQCSDPARQAWECRCSHLFATFLVTPAGP